MVRVDKRTHRPGVRGSLGLRRRERVTLASDASDHRHLSLNSLDDDLDEFDLLLGGQVRALSRVA